ncbi:potassium-transporting ATPase subunit KdpC [Streptomyces yaizuensis]|uniref:Potassium-transporting ATPase KdpC subunit n=1 Tax=Streptomyces yaizuensis TaxID=2989713 RepID=A0ABQ5NRI2_9ACTN|nr:potassium-transporting ATPase subunit KdpC [Streptomyces sp. YSPA8]GLF92984.1 potassium-transporting ATPase subunit KdpC [Streptomyces sp. YSPA8]
MSPHLPPALRRHLSALRMLLVFTAVTGIAYPLAVTGVARVAFPHQADGSLIEDNGTPVGSRLIGQNFTTPGGQPDPRWFQPRPSAADGGKGAGAYDPEYSGASNLGPDNADLVTSIERRRAAVAALDRVPPHSIPADALTAGGSGLDPHISPAYARQQATRVARARRLHPLLVHALVTRHIQGPDLGFLGQERVNVVELNHALKSLK